MCEVPSFLSSPASIDVAELRCCVNQKVSDVEKPFDSEVVLHFGCRFIGIGLSPWRCRYLLRDIFVADGLISLELVPNRRFLLFLWTFLVSPANVVVGVFLVVPMFEAYVEKCCSSSGFHR